MRKGIVDAFRLAAPLGKKRQGELSQFAPYMGKSDLANLKYLFKLRRVGIHLARLSTSSSVVADRAWPQLHAAVEDEKVVRFVSRINTAVENAATMGAFEEFKADAVGRIERLVAPQILGLDSAKRAAALQLFCQEPIHILLLGDPGTGKTEILRSIERLAPHAAFGLGSGASKAGLIGVFEGKEFNPGLLVESDEGLALIDELNLMKGEDQAGLYSAMEKGFVTYDKKGRHERFDARIRVLATANPKNDRFRAIDVDALRNQLPFEEALLSRFHLMFIIRKPTPKALEQIARKIVKQEVVELPDGDARFVQEYVKHAERLEADFDPKFESMVVDFIDGLKKNEHKYLVEISPRLVVGVIRMAKGFARARLSRHTSAEDVEAAMRLMKDALTVS